MSLIPDRKDGEKFLLRNDTIPYFDSGAKSHDH